MLAQLRTAARLAVAGRPVARVRVLRDGNAALRLGVLSAGVRTGVLDALAEGSADVALVSRRLNVLDPSLLEPFLRTLEAARLVSKRGERWSLTPRSRAVLQDSVARGGASAFGGFYLDLYHGLPSQLAGGPSRNDIENEGETIAQVSEAIQPFVDEAIVKVVREASPKRVLDIGCGSGELLKKVLWAAPAAVGVGIDIDPTAAAMAERTLTAAGLGARASVVRDDVNSVLDRFDQLDGPVDLVLAANVLYYFPLAERVRLLRRLREATRRGGRLVLVTSAVGNELFSRHFDLLLRAQGAGMELPDMRLLEEQVLEAGWHGPTCRRVAPGMSIFLLSADA